MRKVIARGSRLAGLATCYVVVPVMREIARRTIMIAVAVVRIATAPGAILVPVVFTTDTAAFRG
jgi:hypothetical protein